MVKEDLYLIVGSVFIKGNLAHPNAKAPNTLAEKIVETMGFEDKKKITSKTLVNYYKYYVLEKGNKQNPKNDTVILLINYWSNNSFTFFKQAFNYFENNKPSESFVKNNVPLFNNTKHEEPKENERKEDFPIINNITIQNEGSKISKYSVFFYVVVLAIVTITISIGGFYFYNQKGDTNIDVGGVEINNDFRQITPTKETQFFSKENNQPLVWYTSYNNQLDFFNGKGIHPVSGEQLQPITKEMVRTYFIEKIPLEQNINTKTPTIVPIEKNIRTSSSIFNQSVINTAKNIEISVFIFDSNYKIDHTFTNYLKKELQSKKYYVTAPLILPSKLNSKIIERIMAQDFSYFKEDLKKYTDYICVGRVGYKFIEETNSTNLVVCKIQVEYTIISITTGETIENYSNVITGNGFSKISAKNNTLKKINL